MAVYGWIFSNAKLQGARLDYQVRGGYRELLPWCKNSSSLLPSVAARLLSVDHRNTNPNQPLSWFGGYLDREHYVVAVGGTQRQLLSGKVDDGSYRLQLCVFAYVLTGPDIRAYRQDPGMFAPLKEKLINIQETGVEREKPEDSCRVAVELSEYALSGDTRPSMGGADNILRASTETDAAVWALSRERPVATSLAGQRDARRFLELFPGGMASVAGGSNENYCPGSEAARRPSRRGAEPEASYESAQAPSEADQRKRAKEAARIEALRQAEEEDRRRIFRLAAGLIAAAAIIAGIALIVRSHIF